MKKKILHIIGGMGRGGAPIFIVNNLKHIDDTKVQFDFLCRKDNCAYNDIIQQHGGRLFVVPPFPKRIFSNFFQTYLFFKKHATEYEAIHVHANALYYILPLVLGKVFGIKKIILHSHSTHSSVGFLKALHYINRSTVSRLANIHLACSQEAGIWMYKDKSFEVINNAVDATKFKFSPGNRDEIRKEFGISNETYVVGHVGRFETVKNHSFIVDVFKKFHEENPSSALFFVGEGSLLDEIKQKVESLGLKDVVYFSGPRYDVDKIYSAFDLFLLPSLFEGLPFVLIEAQCSGVDCLVSSNVTNEAFITDLVTSLKLDDNIDTWVSTMQILSKSKKDRSLFSKIIEDKHYNIEYTASRLTEIYTEEL